METINISGVNNILIMISKKLQAMLDDGMSKSELALKLNTSTVTINMLLKKDDNIKLSAMMNIVNKIGYKMTFDSDL